MKVLGSVQPKHSQMFLWRQLGPRFSNVVFWSTQSSQAACQLIKEATLALCSPGGKLYITSR